jgi:hypothetical protein
MTRLRAVRHTHVTFEARFFERSALFWPIARAARTFAERADWPAVAEYGAAFEEHVRPVRFELAPPRRRRSPGPIVRGELYDAAIALRGVVPTRARMWHDYLNALVWASFPRAKAMLHRRQHAAIERWIPDGARQLPNARTRELDALALLDEGGVLVIGGTPLVFGHALFEGLVLGQPAMVASSLALAEAELCSPDREAIVRFADARLAALLADVERIVDPRELRRFDLSRCTFPAPT